MRRTSCLILDPDLCALKTLTQSVELGRKILQDRIDRIPSVLDQRSQEDWDRWRQSLQNHAQWNPQFLECIERDEKELLAVQERLRKRGSNCRRSSRQ